MIPLSLRGGSGGLFSRVDPAPLSVVSLAPACTYAFPSARRRGFGLLRLVSLRNFPPWPVAGCIHHSPGFPPCHPAILLQLYPYPSCNSVALYTVHLYTTLAGARKNPHPLARVGVNRTLLPA